MSTPLSALATYTVFSFLGIGDRGDMTGLALLVSVCYLFILYLSLSCQLNSDMHLGRYIFVCCYCTPASKTSFTCAWRDASNDTRVYYYLRNVYSSCIQVIPPRPLNCAIEVCLLFITYKKCDIIYNPILNYKHDVHRSYRLSVPLHLTKRKARITTTASDKRYDL